MPVMPIMPSVNTCMSLTTVTTTTTTNTNALMNAPEVNTTQLQALADVCSTVTGNDSLPLPNVTLNSFVSATKIVTNAAIPNPIVNSLPMPTMLPLSSVGIPMVNLNQDNQFENKDTDKNTSNDNNFDIEVTDEKFMNTDVKKLDEPMPLDEHIDKQHHGNGLGNDEDVYEDITEQNKNDELKSKQHQKQRQEEGKQEQEQHHEENNIDLDIKDEINNDGNNKENVNINKYILNGSGIEDDTGGGDRDDSNDNIDNDEIDSSSNNVTMNIEENSAVHSTEPMECVSSVATSSPKLLTKHSDDVVMSESVSVSLSNIFSIILIKYFIKLQLLFNRLHRLVVCKLKILNLHQCPMLTWLMIFISNYTNYSNKLLYY